MVGEVGHCLALDVPSEETTSLIVPTVGYQIVNEWLKQTKPPRAKMKTRALKTEIMEVRGIFCDQQSGVGSICPSTAVQATLECM